MTGRPARSRLLWAPIFGAAAVLTSQPLLAQNPPASGDDALVLQYKHTAGAIQRFKSNAKMDMTIAAEGGSGAGAAMAIPPISLSMNTAHNEKVVGVKDGRGVLAVKVDAMSMNTAIMGSMVQSKLVNGRMVTTVNGKPSPATAMAGNVGDITQVMTIVRDGQGIVMNADGTASPLGGMFGNSVGTVLAQFPPRPVKVGETWEFAQRMRFPLPPQAGQLTGNIPDLMLKFTHTFREVQVKEGRRFAMIDTVAAGETTEAPANSPIKFMKQNFTGATRFDIEGGKSAGGSYTMDFSMGMNLAGLVPQGAQAAPGGQQPPSAIKLDGSMTMTVAEDTSPPAKAAAKKPTKASAKRKPAPARRKR